MYNEKSAKRGKYVPINDEKYKGKRPVVFLSLWEAAFCRYCDLNPAILSWGKESVIIKYKDYSSVEANSPIPPPIRKYVIDFYMIVNTINGVKKYLVEIKPKADTINPDLKYKNKENMTSVDKQKYQYEKKAYIKNICKWDAARKAAAKYGMSFIIMTESQLFAKRIKK